ncbi:MAG: flagellar hook capping protein [Planctomycetaceae bacterium]|nr:flagellar hook capping protein [Planctomycetaceae bacterium]
MADQFTGVLGTQQFLNLYVTQLQYQDPLSPLDQTDSLAQLAQFSQLEASQTLNRNFEQLLQLQIQSQSTNVATAGAGFLGRNVTFGNSGSGVVSGVHYDNNQVAVQIGDLLVPIENITGVSLAKNA